MTVKNSIGILLVDDHAIVREGYRSLLSKQPGMHIIAEAAEGHEAYTYFKEQQPDLVIMDISLPGQSGLETICRIKKRCSSARILVFTMHQSPSFAVQAMRAGALGYVTKSSQPETLINAIREVHAGRLTLSPDISEALALAKLNGIQIEFDSLTVRELEILRLLVEAKSVDDIADILHISPKTVANCHYLIKRKLCVTSDIELTRLAMQMNLIDISDTTKI